jgi:hypothetical protein
MYLTESLSSLNLLLRTAAGLRRRAMDIHTSLMPSATDVAICSRILEKAWDSPVRSRTMDGF